MLEQIRRLWRDTRLSVQGSAGTLTKSEWSDERDYWQQKLFEHYRTRYGLTPHRLQTSEALVPPPELATRIQNTSKASPPAFFATGYRQAWLYLQELELLGIDPRELPGILDFGVGFGRLLIHFLPFDVPLYGCDVTPETIDWSRRGLQGVAQLDVTTTTPVLPYQANQLGFVYANSVFTHIPLKVQLPWAQELARIVRPGGAIIASYLDANGYLSQLPFREFYQHWETGDGFNAEPERGVQMTTYLSDDALQALWSQVGEVVAIRHHFREQKHVVVRKLPPVE